METAEAVLVVPVRHSQAPIPCREQTPSLSLSVLVVRELTETALPGTAVWIQPTTPTQQRVEVGVVRPPLRAQRVMVSLEDAVVVVATTVPPQEVHQQPRVDMDSQAVTSLIRMCLLWSRVVVVVVVRAQ